MCCYWFRHQKQTVSHTAKKLYDFISEKNCLCPLYYDLWYSSDCCLMFLHKWIFCFTIVKIVCCYWILLCSGSINSTSLLFGFMKIVFMYNMNSKKSYQKMLIIQDTNEKSFDLLKCIIFQCQLDTTVSFIENGRRKIIEAAAVRKDQV